MLYTKKELAEYLRTTERSIDRLVATGQLPVIRLGARACRYRPEDVERYLAEQTTQNRRYTPQDIAPGVKYVPGMKVV